MANLLDQASILLTPTAYDNGKVLCVKPSAAPYGDFDFSRNSSATRVNAQGLVEDVQILSGNLVTNGDFSEEGTELLTQPVNLVTDFTTNSGGVIVDADTFETFGGSYDGIKKANLLIVGKSYKIVIEGNTTSSGFTIGNNTASGNEYGIGFGTHYFIATVNSVLWIRQKTSGTTNITSFSVKEVGQDWVLQTGWSIAEDKAVCEANGGFDVLSQVSVLNSGNSYKVTYTADLSLITSGTLKLGAFSNSESERTILDGTNTAYLTASGTSFQINEGGAIGTATITDISVIEVTSDTNLPRINYDGFSFDGSGNIIPNSGCGSWLWEGQSTNLQIQSQVFSGYNGSNQVVTDNSISSPDGTITGAILADNNSGGTGTVQIYDNVTVDVSSDYTLSIFAKKKDLDFIALRIGSFTTPSTDQSYFNLNLGTVVSEGSGQTAKIENYGNGWFRCSVTFTTDVADTSGFLTVRLSENGSSTVVDMDNTSNIYIWGMQFEKQSYATSYIPTEGTTVTRNQDVCTNGGSAALINSTEGVLYAEIATLTQDNDSVIEICLNGGSSANRVAITFTPATNTLRTVVRVGGTNVIDFTNVLSSITSFNKIAIKYKENDFSLFVNGTELQTSTSGNIFPASTLNSLDFDNASGASNFFGKTKCLAVFPYLSDSELAELTTI